MRLTSIGGSGRSDILISPQDWNDPGAQWCVYIPPTRPEHFEGGDPVNGAVLGPWGETYWATLSAALGFVVRCMDAGEIVSNEGEVLR